LQIQNVFVTQPFFFMRKGTEFTARIARLPEGRGFMISFGVADQEAWIAMRASKSAP
jgi:hypothetical protein